MEAYTDFAKVYDEFMDETPYDEWCERIYDLIKKYHRKDDETTAEVNMIVEDKKAKKSKKITYKGPVSGVKDALTAAAENLFKEE